MTTPNHARAAAEALYVAGYLYLGMQGCPKPIGGAVTIIQQAIDAATRERDAEIEKLHLAHRWLRFFTDNLAWRDFMRTRGCDEGMVSEVEGLVGSTTKENEG